MNRDYFFSLLHERGLTRTQFTKEFKIPSAHVTNVLRGTASPTIRWVNKLVSALNLSAEETCKLFEINVRKESE